MDKVLAIIKREYLTRVRSKGFILGTVLSPLLMASFILVPILVARSGGREDTRITVLDQTGEAEVYTRVAQQFVGEKAGGIELAREAAPPGEDLTARRQELNRRITRGEISGYVELPPDVLERGKFAYHAKNVSDFATNARLERAFEAALFEQRLSRAGLDAARVTALNQGLDMEVINERGERERGQTFILGYVLVLILYVTILVYGLMVMRGVIEEKQSRIVEVLLSSVRPFQLMLGKLVGIGLVGLTQYSIWAAFTLLLSALVALPALAASPLPLPRIPASLIAFFVIYFLLGYFLYATLYTLVGAIVSSDEDGQQAQMPITLLLVVQMVILTLILRNPDGTMATTLSLIPFFSPIIMFMRIAVQPPPWWQIALSLALLLATILGILWLAAKIYRVGVLMYGKRPTLPELARWLKYS